MRKTGLFLVFLAFSGLVRGAEPPPLEELFRHAEFDVMRLSPDGKHLAATAPDGDQTGVVILNIESMDDVSVVSSYKLPRYENVAGIQWVSDEHIVMGSTRQEGSLNWPRPTGRIYAMDTSGALRSQVFGPVTGAANAVFRVATVLHGLPDVPGWILVQDIPYSANPIYDDRRPRIWEVELATGRKSLAGKSPLNGGRVGVDNEGVVRFAVNRTEELEWEFAYRPDAESDWETFTHDFAGRVEFWGMDDDNEHFFIKNRDRENMGVFRVNPNTGTFEKVLGSETFEPAEPIRDARNETLIGAIFESGIPESRFLDPEHEAAKIRRSLQASMPDYEIRIFNFTDDGDKAVVLAYSDREPGVFLLFDIESMAARQLAARRSWIDPETMGAMRPVQFQARDGMEIHGFLTLPPGVEEPDNLPMVVEVHGGPYGPYDRWGWSPWIQSMATRGYAVLQVNFRGSGNFGVQFERAGYREWGGKIQDDIIDGTRWAIETGVAHPERVCISGGSFGGYSAMMAIVREPDLYACSFPFVGIYDMELMFEKGDIQESDFGMNYLKRVLGEDEAELRKFSPIHHLDKVKAELFIGHGEEDVRAHVAHYHALIEKLDEKGIPYDSLLQENEGHGFYEVDNNVKLYGRALDLFDRTIGSGWSPSGDGESVAAADD